MSVFALLIELSGKRGCIRIQFDYCIQPGTVAIHCVNT